jgi:protein SCO1/2
MRLHFLLPLFMSLVLPLAAPLQLVAAKAPKLGGIAYEQKPGSELPGTITVRDDTGRILRFADLFDGKPLILDLGYFHCPNLCSVVRASVFRALAQSGLVAGRDYSLAVLSIDPSETSVEAAAAKAEDIGRYPVPGAAKNWHYLTGEAAAIAAIADAAGFRSRLSPQRNDYIHPAGIVFVTPDGRVSSYLLGAGFDPGAVREAVAHAGSGTIARTASPILLLCFDYDAATGRYTPAVMKLLRLAAAITVAALAVLILRSRLAERGV